MDFISKLANELGDHNPAGANQGNAPADGDRALHLPGFVTNAIDNYLDGLHPEMVPRVVAEIENCQNWTLAQVERKVHEVFQQIFSGNFEALTSQNAGTVVPPGQTPPTYEYKPADRGFPQTGAVFEGQQFVADPVEAGANAREIKKTGPQEFAEREFAGLPDVIQGYRDTGSQGGAAYGERGLFSQDQGTTDRGLFSDMKAGFNKFADKVQDKVEDVGDSIDKLQDKLDPRQKALELIPKIREWINEILKDHHRGLAELFVGGAIEKGKVYLRGNIEPRDIASDAGGLATSVMSAFGGNSGAGERGLGGERGLVDGLQGIFSKKAMASVRDIRGSARELLHAEIIKREADIWNKLPDGVRRPLEIVFGKDPFNQQPGAANGERGIMDHGPFRMLKEALEKLEQSLRNLISGLVQDAHRGLENGAIRQVEDVIMAKVHKVLPNAQLPPE
ncbi:hypothetical protein HK097_008765 [Rhizophlyctis rosea]|uniref:Uncharacterized protein n=1 Tax=Rhizophlyctis rosea TaxID=64517 RepID=A0AAD5SCN1_9FUNG|nr:hypothetical protein HK097_008765 [Rhizophlyctis rosea]